jgi:hypothetical protein
MRTVFKAEFLFISGLIFSSDLGFKGWGAYLTFTSPSVLVDWRIFNVDLKIKFSLFNSNLDGNKKLKVKMF